MKEALLNWYDKNKKPMPWRLNVDPYRIWISEVMLQQTQVTTVIPYYEKWMYQFPSVDMLAQADIEDVLKLWEGLGYYQRAHNIKKTAEIIINELEGDFPSNETLKALPGIGEYIYSAIMSIAFNAPTPVIDGNVKRVGSRFWEQQFISARDIKDLRIRLEEQISKKRAGCFNQAMMDLGREICKPINPECSQCPISSNCQSFQNKTIKLYPYKPKKKKIPLFDVVVGYIEDQNKRFIITKRPDEKMLGGLWELPGGKREKGESLRQGLTRELKEELDIGIAIQLKLGMVEHAYSHMKIKLHAYKCKIDNGTIKQRACQDLKWITKKDINKYSFPTANHKLFKKIGEC
tara:strand:- start:99 stop:1142 length:1044 start_codon:yes stop_codon:yes gene_type:complete